MPSIDVSPYVDLALYDVEPQDLVTRALAQAGTRFPGWVPREGQTEVVLLEAMAAQVAELVFATNRVPGAVTEVLLRLFGLNRDPGAAPSASVTFTVAASPGGQTVPAGTRVRLLLGTDVPPLDFRTMTDLAIPANTTTGTVTAVADVPTTAGAGTPANTALQVVDAVPFVDSAKLATVVGGGLDPEDGQAFLDRGATALQRLVSTLVLPEHFTAAAAQQPYVVRATTLDAFTPDGLPIPTDLVVTPATGSGGTLPASTPFTYRVSAINAHGETQATAAVTATTGASVFTDARLVLTWTAVSAPVGMSAVTGYRVYGRVAGQERQLAQTAAGVTTWTDLGTAPLGPNPPLVTNSSANPIGTARGMFPWRWPGLAAAR